MSKNPWAVLGIVVFAVLGVVGAAAGAPGMAILGGVVAYVIWRKVIKTPSPA